MLNFTQYSFCPISTVVRMGSGSGADLRARIPFQTSFLSIVESDLFIPVIKVNSRLVISRRRGPGNSCSGTSCLDIGYLQSGLGPSPPEALCSEWRIFLFSHLDLFVGMQTPIKVHLPG